MFIGGVVFVWTSKVDNKVLFLRGLPTLLVKTYVDLGHEMVEWERKIFTSHSYIASLLYLYSFYPSDGNCGSYHGLYTTRELYRQLT